MFVSVVLYTEFVLEFSKFPANPPTFVTPVTFPTAYELLIATVIPADTYTYPTNPPAFVPIEVTLPLL